jgi:hypothetical protein
MGSSEWACAYGWKKVYMTNQIGRIRALNCFDQLTLVNWHLKCCNSVIGLYLTAKKKVLNNEIVQIGALHCLKSCIS